LIAARPARPTAAVPTSAPAATLAIAPVPLLRFERDALDARARGERARDARVRLEPEEREARALDVRALVARVRLEPELERLRAEPEEPLGLAPLALAPLRGEVEREALCFVLLLLATWSLLQIGVQANGYPDCEAGNEPPRV
jgi:hypothetical protein